MKPPGGLRARRARSGRAAAAKPAGGRKRPARAARIATVDRVAADDLEALRAELGRRAVGAELPRFNPDPEDVQRSVVRLVLALVEFLRKLMERQAIRRMQAGTLTAEEVEAVGQALMRLEETVHDLAGRFGIDPAELNLDLGPLGRLL